MKSHIRFISVVLTIVMMLSYFNLPGVNMVNAISDNADALSVADRIQIYSQGNGDFYKIMHYFSNGKTGGDLGGWGCGWFALCHALQWVRIEPKDIESNNDLPIRLHAESNIRTCGSDNQGSDQTGIGVAIKWLKGKYTNLIYYGKTQGNLKSVLSNGGAAIINQYGHFYTAVNISSDGQYVQIVDSCMGVPKSNGVKLYKYNGSTGFEETTWRDCIVDDNICWYVKKGTSGHNELFRQSTPNLTRSGGEYWVKYSEVSSRVLYYIENSNPEPDYVSLCTRYGSYGRIYVKNAATVKSLPCSSGTNSESTDIESATGKTYIETGIYKNTAGNYWYQVKTSNGQIGYIYSGHISQFTPDYSDIIDHSSNISAPVTIQRGNTFATRGTICTKYSKLFYVAASIKSGSIIKYYSGFSTESNSVNLYTSEINSNMKFSELEVGNYTYTVSGSVKNYWVGYLTDNDNLYYETKDVDIKKADFTVNSSQNPTIAAEFVNVEVVDITSNSAGLTYRCNLTGCMNNVVSYTGINLYDENGTFLRKTNIEEEHLSGNYNYFYAQGTPHKITGLEAGTTYKAQIYAVVNGSEVPSEFFTFTTLSNGSESNNPINVTYTVNITNVTPTTASLSYRCDLPSNVYNNVVSFIGAYLYDANGNELDTIYYSEAGLSGNYTYFYNNDIPIANLEPNTSYCVRVFSVLSGNTVFSDYMYFTTNALTSDVDYFNYTKTPINSYLIVMNGDATMYTDPNVNGTVATPTVNGSSMSVIPRYRVVYADYIGKNADGTEFYHLSNAVGHICDQIGETYVKADLLSDLRVGKYVVCPFTNSTTTISVYESPDISSAVVARWNKGSSFYFLGDVEYGFNTEKDLYGGLGKVSSGSTEGWGNVGYYVYDNTHIHSFGEYSAYEFGDAFYHGHTCMDCGYTEYEEHIIVDDAAIQPTCTETGLTVGSHCSVCGEVITQQTVIPALGHSFGTPTWTWNGYSAATAKFTCSNDANHTQTVTATITSEVTKAATCTEAGTKVYTATATFNGNVYTNTKTETLPSTGHTYGAPVYTWVTDYSTVTATRICTNDPSHKETETVTTTSEVTKQPTFDANGETTYTAVFANPAFTTQTKVVANIPKLTDPDITFTIGTATGKAGENVKVPLSVSGKTQVAGLIMYNFTYDTAKLEFIGFTDYGTLVTDSVAGTSSVNSNTGIINLGYQTALIPEGVICYAEFRIKDDVEDCNVAVSCSVSASFGGSEVPNAVEAGAVKVLNWIHGDFNNDGTIDMEDAVYFIGWINFSYLGDMYVITYDGNMDFNNDGTIDMEDAVYFIGWINFSYLGDMYVINW